MDEETSGIILAIGGWIATGYGTYMSQGTWPSVAALGLIAALLGMTVVLKEAIRGAKGAIRGAARLPRAIRA
jgi:hypothetical protein